MAERWQSNGRVKTIKLTQYFLQMGNQIQLVTKLFHNLERE